MKILIIAAVCLLSAVCCAQGVKFSKGEYFTITAAVDPVASFKEESVDFVGEIEYVHAFMYVKAGFQVFPGVRGGYFDVAGATGVNLTYGYFDRVRFYGGVRLGNIQRDGVGYPLFGFESGIDYRLNDHWFVGIRGTSDWREDFKFSGADAKWRQSGFVRVGYRYDYKKCKRWKKS